MYTHSTAASPTRKFKQGIIFPIIIAVLHGKIDSVIDTVDLTHNMIFFSFFSAKIYIDKKLKRHSSGETDGFLSDIYHNCPLTKKELYAAITELQIGGVETVSMKTFKIRNRNEPLEFYGCL